MPRAIGIQKHQFFKLGDYVIAGRAHQTLRFERIEQGSVVMITDTDVRRVMGPACVTWGRKPQLIEAQAIRDYFAAQ